MLENLVAWVLNAYIGDYLEDLNTDQLSVAILQGQVELENVPLKKSALRKFDIPLQVKSGLLGKLTLSVPITRMRSEPWVVKMSDLLVLLEPSDLNNYNFETIEMYEQSKKEQLLDELEKQHKKQLLTNMGLWVDDSLQKNWWGYSLVSTIINNIQLIITNVHIRYEDNITLPNGAGFSFGIRVHCITAQTTNSQWKPDYIQPQHDVNIFKKLNLEGLSFYWNSGAKSDVIINSYSELQHRMAPEMNKDDVHILQPFSAQLFMEKNSSKFPLKIFPFTPRFKFNLRAEKLNIELTKRQLNEMRFLAEEWSRYDRAREHRKWRPLVPLAGNAKEWWSFAYNRIQDEIHQRNLRKTWNFVIARVKQLNSYCRAYRRRLLAIIESARAEVVLIVNEVEEQNELIRSFDDIQMDLMNPLEETPKHKTDSLNPSLSNEDIFLMKQIERDSSYTFQELQLFREAVYYHICIEEKKMRKFSNESDSDIEVIEAFNISASQKASDSCNHLEGSQNGTPQDSSRSSRGLYGWLSSWFFGAVEDMVEKNGSSEEIRENTNIPMELKELGKRLEGEILDVLSESRDDSTLLRRDVILADIVMHLKQLMIRFIDENELNTKSNYRYLAMDLRDVKSCIRLSPYHHSTALSFSVQDMNIQRLYTSNNKSCETAEYDDDSLIFGFGTGLISETTQLLFTMGKAKYRADCNQFGSSTRRSNQAISEPIFEVVYRRKSPKRMITHTIDAKFSDLSFMYNEGAFSDLIEMFGCDSVDIQSNDSLNAQTFGQIFLKIEIPQAQIELRRNRGLLGESKGCYAASPFALVNMKRISIVFENVENNLSKCKFGFGELDVKDLFEPSDKSLFRTAGRNPMAYLKPLYSSCPNLQNLSTMETMKMNRSKSLPMISPNSSRRSQRSSQWNNVTNKITRSSKTRTIYPILTEELTNNDSFIIFTFVNCQHPLFDSFHKKANCFVEVVFPFAEVGLNRRTWALILDYFGFCGKRTDMNPYSTRLNDSLFLQNILSPKLERKQDSYCKKIDLKANFLRINMNYPANGNQLGVINADDFMLSFVFTGIDDQPFTINISASSFSLSDSTQFYSELYKERVVIKWFPDLSIDSSNGKSSRINIFFQKYTSVDLDLRRDWDVHFVLQVPVQMNLVYVHTHRYICALYDFWQQFFDLMDQLNKRNSSTDHFIIDGQRQRIKLDIIIECSSVLIFPLNQFSNNCIVAETTNIRATNQFKFSSFIKYFEQYNLENQDENDDLFNCLIDWLTIKFSDVRLYEGFRVEISKVQDVQGYESICQFLSQSYCFFKSKVNVFSQSHDLEFDCFRNLDAAISHSVPNLAVVSTFNDMNLMLTADFYCLCRGFLQLNLGDQIITIPETVPVEVLLKPIDSCEVGSSNKYVTFALRLNLINVKFDCLVRSSYGVTSFVPFACIRLNRSRFFFNNFVDNQSEMDLICENYELHDTRIKYLNDGKLSSVFPIVLCSKTPNDVNRNFMSEAHLMMKKDETPVLTLVLMNARVLLFLDWFAEAKNFILLNTDFVPPVDDVKQDCLFVNSGIIQRNQPCATTNIHEQTIMMKITVKESDLVLLEAPESSNSLALIAHITAVLNISDPHGFFGANLEIQRLNIDWCTMADNNIRCQLTNDFSITISLLPESDNLEAEYVSDFLSGLPNFTAAKHHLIMEIKDLVTRASFRDVAVIHRVFHSSIQRLTASQMKNNVSNAVSEMKGRDTINIIHISVKSEMISFWLLDDSLGTVFPIVRFVAKNFNLEYKLKEVSASFIFSSDYFNQRVFGWEPLIEPWHVGKLSATTNNRSEISINLHAEDKSILNVNITQVFLSQALEFRSRWLQIKDSLNNEFRDIYLRSRSDYLPYLLRNEVGSNLKFTIDVEEVIKSRLNHRKSNAIWISVAAGGTCAFEFPTKRLALMDCPDEPRQMIIRIEGWDEVSPVSVDAVGTYFRLARCSSLKAPCLANARLVIVVNMDKNGRKVVIIRSALTIISYLANPVLVMVGYVRGSVDNASSTFRIATREKFHVPLKFANSHIAFKPDGCDIIKSLKIDWQEAKNMGEYVNNFLKFESSMHKYYWVCVSIKREHFPDYEHLSGHTISLMPPLTLLNLFPIDLEFNVAGITYAVAAGKQLYITDIDISCDIWFSLTTERFISVETTLVTRSVLSYKPSSSDPYRLHLRMRDIAGRFLDAFASISVGCSGAVSISFWVPYWIVNKSGIPLILKQDATNEIAAGQLDEHERAKDRHPLMFSFADDNCPQQCVVRLGNEFTKNKGYRAIYSRKFILTLGVHALKLYLTHDHEPSLIYNIGVEIRQGTGRYKDTQVVLFTPRYILCNETSYSLFASHVDVAEQRKHCVKIASKCNLIWNENFEDNRLLCIKQEDIKYWSCPFRIDQINSFHLTMRDSEEIPRFLRVEIILSSSVFYITFTDAKYFPPPIQIENLSDVPILYNQMTERPDRGHLRTICKARSIVDYAWDNLYAPKLLTLQVFENKSHSYDPQKIGMGPPLVYDNDVYIKLVHSFDKNIGNGFTDEQELVLETMKKGKVILNKINLSDSSCSQLWRFTKDGCLENIAMNNRAKPGERYVLDVLEKGGFVLMVVKRNSARDRFQKWHLTPDCRLRCKIDGMFVEARCTDLILAPANSNSPRNYDGIPKEQVWQLQPQRPGSGVLDVECLHRGPTLVLRIRDRKKLDAKSLGSRVPRISEIQRNASNDLSFLNIFNLEMNISLPSGIGLSLINGQREELIYARFHDIVLHGIRRNGTYQITGHVGVIQVDNQLLATDRWQLLYCFSATMAPRTSLFDPYINRPAVKIEMSCTPLEHYDAFDCLRIRLCDITAQLDETLLWKLVQFVQESEAANSIHPSTLLQPPNIELERPDNSRARRCYFGTLDLEIGDVTLSAVTVGNSGLPAELRKLKRQFNVKLVSFENAMVVLPAFRQFRYFETFPFLIDTLRNFYLAELKNQTFNIIVTMDAFGNPLGLASDLKESFEGLLFEGDLGGFVSGLGYGVTNSISKVASSMAHGVGTLTFDEEHELMRQRILRYQYQAGSNSALAHFYSGIKGLGVGVFGGITAIVTNTYTGTKREGFAGALKGITTGAVDTVTKPVQGIFDLVEGTASAFKEIVGGPSARKSYFPDNRVRLPRVCTSLQSLLPCYSDILATAQMDLLRINNFATNEYLLDVEVFLEQRSNNEMIRQYAMICSETCYIIRQIDGEPSSVVQRIAYKLLKQMQPLNVSKMNNIASIEIILEFSAGKRQILPHLWCGGMEIATRLCDKVTRAKHLYDHNKRTLIVAEDYEVL